MERGGYLQAVVGAIGGAEGAILADNGVYRIEYTGGNDVFAFRFIEDSRGTFAPNSVINVGPFLFYWSEDGIRAFNGSQSIPIGDQKVDDTVLGELSTVAANERIYASADLQKKLVYWAYPTSQAGDPNKILIYNWEIGRFSYAEVTTQLIYEGLTPSLTLEDLDVYGTMETLPYSLDSRAWQGGRSVLAGFDGSNQMGYFDGGNLEATLETTEYKQDNGRRIVVTGIRPLVDGGTVTVALRHRDTPSASLTTNSATSVGSDGVAPQRQACRYARAQVSVGASSTWTHAQGVEPVIIEEGLR